VIFITCGHIDITMGVMVCSITCFTWNNIQVW